MKLIHLTLIATALLGSFAISSCSNTKKDTEAVGSDIDTLAHEATGAIGTVTSAQAVTVLKSGESLPESDGRPMVIDFSATWCGPCRSFAPNFHQVAEELSTKVRFFTVDVDDNPRMAAEYNVESIPTVIYLHPDGTYATTLGYMTASQFRSRVNTLLQ